MQVQEFQGTCAPRNTEMLPAPWAEGPTRRLHSCFREIAAIPKRRCNQQEPDRQRETPSNKHGRKLTRSDNSETTVEVVVNRSSRRRRRRWSQQQQQQQQ